ncbi:MAG TPA: sugar transferase [Dehalococcoidia bacterium]|nr:sugar transferase [Dehalococcoidia bacterium]
MAYEASRGTSVLETDLLLDESVALSGEIVPSFYVRHGKRALDLILGTVLLLLLSPLILLLAGLVALSSGFPPFYAATRMGKGGRPFRMWKLRSMVKDADAVLQRWQETASEEALIYFQSYKLKRDPRVTGLGRILRKTSLDELPQLWNVVRGDMSLIGPRPIVEAEVENYGPHAPLFLSVRPGITGLWQINGRNAVEYPERAMLELRYMTGLSIGSDVSILAKTALVLLRADGL